MATGLTEAEWTGRFLDESGRVVAESALRKLVFRSGVDVTLRRQIWPFLLGVYSFHSTYREREVLVRERRVEYAALKARWKEVLEPDADADDTGLMIPAGDDAQYQFMFLQAKVSAMRHTIDETLARQSMKAIEKDVPRTDRKTEYFQGEGNERLRWLNDILVTYAVFHPTVGYAQKDKAKIWNLKRICGGGMNDVLSMILMVMDDEANAYSCFANYMATIQADFMATGMMRKLEALQELLTYLDAELREHFVSIDAGELVFCHRWLLLSFKREFEFLDALRLFETLCSHHLEVSSMEAEKARREERRIETARAAGEPASVPGGQADKVHFTYELFVCLAILRHYRAELLSTKDIADVFTFINGLVSKMDLNEILAKAEQIFFEYCRKTVRQPDETFLLRT